MTDDEGNSAPATDEDGKPVYQSTYTGQYAANLKEGEGVFEYPDGSKYQGNWRHDKRHGDGVYWYANGDIYSGEWRFGTKHGRGTFIHGESNAKLIGTYVDGQVRTLIVKVSRALLQQNSDPPPSPSLQYVKGKWVMADATYTGGYKENKPFGDQPRRAAFFAR